MSSPHIEMTVREQSWPLDNPFRTARGPSTETRVVVVTVSNGQQIGRGEGVPIKRYGQDIASSVAELNRLSLTGATGRMEIQKSLPANAARNALDCALWDLEAKIAGKRVWELANIETVDAVETAFTISLDSPEKMALVAGANGKAPVLKLKLGGDKLDLARVEAVRNEAPAARFFVDANESWSPAHYQQNVSAFAQLGVELIEQPFPAGSDAILESLDHPVPVCADESCHTSADLPNLVRRYEAINVKLDKTGGLTEALFLTKSARQAGFKLLFGCMVCTSLGIAPARILARTGDFVDLDGPLLLAGDRHHPLNYNNGRIGLPSRELWG